MKIVKRHKEMLQSPGVRLSNGTVVAVKLASAELNGVLNKLAPKYAGPCVVAESFLKMGRQKKFDVQFGDKNGK